MRTRAAKIAAPLVVAPTLLALTACVPSDQAPAAPTAAASAELSEPAHDHVTDYHEHEPPTPFPDARWDADSKNSAIDVAVRAFIAFAQPGTPYPEWWAGFSPFLTDDAAQDYAYVDPANIAPTRITGAARLVETSSAYVGEVEMPTDAGRYVVTIARRNAEAPWQVVRIAEATYPQP